MILYYGHKIVYNSNTYGETSHSESPASAPPGFRTWNSGKVTVVDARRMLFDGGFWLLTCLLVHWQQGNHLSDVSL